MPKTVPNPEPLSAKTSPTSTKLGRENLNKTPVDTLSGLVFQDTFNPYLHRCPVHDRDDAPSLRRRALLEMLQEAAPSDVEAIWVGRDLGYRGGRRTGLALTDDRHIKAHATRWSIDITRPTEGEMVSEKTAAVVWDVLAHVTSQVFLWNVFPFHPHEESSPFLVETLRGS